MTDNLDRRLLMCILNKYYKPAVLDDQYTFTPSGVYRAPPEGVFEDCMKYIQGLPLSEGPDVFGMHENANISCAFTEAMGADSASNANQIFNLKLRRRRLQDHESVSTSRE